MITKNINMAAMLLGLLVGNAALALSPLQQAMLQKQAQEAMYKEKDFNKAMAKIQALKAGGAHELAEDLRRNLSLAIESDKARMGLVAFDNLAKKDKTVEDLQTTIKSLQATMQTIKELAKAAAVSRNTRNPLCWRLYYGNNEVTALLKAILGEDLTAEMVATEPTDEEAKKAAEAGKEEAKKKGWLEWATFGWFGGEKKEEGKE